MDTASIIATGTLGKALEVLRAVADCERPPRFTDLLERVPQPRGTLHRHLTNLLQEGLLEMRPDQTYQPGLALLRLASRAWESNQFRSVAEPHLRRLQEAVGETVHLGILDGAEVVYLDKVEGRQAVRMHSQIGKVSPAYCTGVGKAALSILPDDRLEALLPQIAFHGYTESTIADAATLKAEIETIRQSGVAYDRQEHETGIQCVAAPVGGTRLAAGISVTAPAYRVSMERLRSWAPQVRQTAADIMEDMAARLGPRAW